MVTRKAIASILSDYGDIVIATVCSHSSLQIFHGARQEGFRTLGIAIGKQPRFYDAFPLAKPDDFLIVDSYADILDQALKAIQIAVGEVSDFGIGKAAEDEIHLAGAAMPAAKQKPLAAIIKPAARSCRSRHCPVPSERQKPGRAGRG